MYLYCAVLEVSTSDRIRKINMTLRRQKHKICLFKAKYGFIELVITETL